MIVATGYFDYRPILKGPRVDDPTVVEPDIRIHSKMGISRADSQGAVSPTSGGSCGSTLKEISITDCATGIDRSRASVIDLGRDWILTILLM